MSTLSKLCPPVNRHLRSLDRSLFSRHVPVLALRVPAALASKVRKSLNGYLLDLPRVKTLIPDPNSPSSRLVLLDFPADSAPETLESVQSIVAKLDISWDTTKHTLEFNYDYWTADQILKAILPEDTEIISSFESIGDIAHMNLRDHILPYKNMIGQIILDKNSRMTTIVNKTSNIHTQFRTFPLEILATRNPAHTPTELETSVSENGIHFHLNYADVYWNSRLHTEHQRLIVKYFKRGDLIADVMCGIGPFALPAAKFHGCAVVANDLNPESFRWLVHNIKVNNLVSSAHSIINTDPQTDSSVKASSSPKPAPRMTNAGVGYVKPLNMCGREFIRSSTSILNGNDGLFRLEIRPAFMSMATSERQRAKSKKAKAKDPTAHVLAADQHESSVSKWDTVPVKTFSHYIMNLPASALGFLDGFHGMWAPLQDHRDYLCSVRPFVHVYFFTRAAFVNCRENESEMQAIQHDVSARICQVIGAVPDDLVVHRVRLVAPRKDMCCATFKVPEKVLFGETRLGDVNLELNIDHLDENVDNSVEIINEPGAPCQSMSKATPSNTLSMKVKRPLE